MRAGLVGDDVRVEAELEQPRHHVGGVAPQADAHGAPVGLGRVAAGDGVVEVLGHLVQVAGLEPPLDAVAVHVDAQRHPVVHGDGEGLGAAHAAEAGREGDGPRQRAAEAAAADLGEALVGPLQDALRADVDPRARGHLPVHREAELLEPAELVPRPPLGHQVGVGDEHPRRPLVGAEHADRLARLHEHRLVVAQALERADHRVERVPRAGGPARAAVHDEVVGPLGHLRVEVVHQHPHRRLLGPAPAAQLAPPRRPHRPRSTRHVAPPRSSTFMSALATAQCPNRGHERSGWVIRGLRWRTRPRRGPRPSGRAPRPRPAPAPASGPDRGRRSPARVAASAGPRPGRRG